MGFHEVRFPTGVSRNAQGGPERRTDIVTLGSGYEERNSRWADSRRNYNAGYGVRSIDDLYAVIAFFEERRGRLHGFRWRDPVDWKSCQPGSDPSSVDQPIGEGTGVISTFQIKKMYGTVHAPWVRQIRKTVVGTVVVAVDGEDADEGTDYSVDHTTGLVTFLPGHVPGNGAVVTAGFAFDVPVRFDSDRLDINLQGFRHGAIPSIPIVEIRL